MKTVVKTFVRHHVNLKKKKKKNAKKQQPNNAFCPDRNIAAGIPSSVIHIKCANILREKDNTDEKLLF